jgi:hypothetical protein
MAARYGSQPPITTSPSRFAVLCNSTKSPAPTKVHPINKDCSKRGRRKGKKQHQKYAKNTRKRAMCSQSATTVNVPKKMHPSRCAKPSKGKYQDWPCKAIQPAHKPTVHHMGAQKKESLPHNDCQVLVECGENAERQKVTQSAPVKRSSHRTILLSQSCILPREDCGHLLCQINTLLREEGTLAAANQYHRFSAFITERSRAFKMHDKTLEHTAACPLKNKHEFLLHQIENWVQHCRAVRNPQKQTLMYLVTQMLALLLKRMDSYQTSPYIQRLANQTSGVMQQLFHPVLKGQVGARKQKPIARPSQWAGSPNDYHNPPPFSLFSIL